LVGFGGAEDHRDGGSARDHGATSNPIIIADIIKEGGLDERIRQLIDQGLDDSAIAWKLNDELVTAAQKAFAPVWERTNGNDGYVSFELDPLLEDARTRCRTGNGCGGTSSWGSSIRQPDQPDDQGAGDGGGDRCAGRAGGARGSRLNVTLCFSERQYKLSRDAIWRGAQRRKSGLEGSRAFTASSCRAVDVWTEKNVPDLKKPAQGLVGIVNAKQMWRMNAEFWRGQERQTTAGDHLRQHGEEARVAGGGLLRRKPRRERHPDQPAGDERLYRQDRQAISAHRSINCRPKRFWTRSRGRWT
jgi:hypothetical protein